MFLTRTYSYQSTLCKEELKKRLTGQHFTIHNLDFEVMDEEQNLSIVPHAEDSDAIQTLPVTKIALKENGKDQLKVVVTSKMRSIDMGLPQLIFIVCFILLIVSGVLYFVSQEPILTYSLAGGSVVIFVLFWIRLETGYFDYVRKIRSQVKAFVGQAV
jgi:hypothetical protein